MKISFNRHSYSKYKENQIRRYFKMNVDHVLGKRRQKRIKEVHIRLMKNWRGKVFNEFPFSHMWDEEKGKAVLFLAPNWMEEKHTRAYGIAHELTHLKDIMDGYLLTEEPENGNKLKVWWCGTLYEKTADNDLAHKLWGCSYNSYCDYLSLYYPWEYEACKVNYYYD